MLENLLKDVKPYPFLGDVFKSKPTQISLAEDGPYFSKYVGATQKEIDKLIERVQKTKKALWSISGDRELRGTLYRENGHAPMEENAVHIGLDVIVPAGTAVYAPFDSEVVDTLNDRTQGGYGFMSVLKCTEDVYLLFGHLAGEGLAPLGTKLKAGDQFAKVGELRENGNWFEHVHLQVLTKKAYEARLYGALMHPDSIEHADELFPSPMPLITASIEGGL
ncbi:MAG: peptidoglycan DD-metalloendopeptidase family protein [Firmicutes bacterium]|nr:peptidoglycan DD-metalloendopeptidase family protein [Bacillota bacterium]